MEIGRLGLGAVAVLFGGGYYFSGTNDFEVVVHRPQGEVYSAFNGLRTFSGGSGLQQAGIATAGIQTSRPSPNELIFTSGPEGGDKSMRIAFTFEPIDGGQATRVRAAIDVPPVKYEIDGEDMQLSESKVENAIEESVAKMAEQIDMGRSPSGAAAELNLTLDLVALASQPDKFNAAQATLERQEAEYEAFEQQQQRDAGW